MHDPGSMKSEQVEVGENDKISIAHDFKWDADFGDVLTQTLGVELVANDGTYWYLLETGIWTQNPPGTGLIIFMNNQILPGYDNTRWQSLNVDSYPIPRSGKLYIYQQQMIPSVQQMFIMIIFLSLIIHLSMALTVVKGEHRPGEFTKCR